MGRATGHAETRKSLSTNGLRTGTPNQLRQQQRWTCLTLGYLAYPMRSAVMAHLQGWAGPARHCSGHRRRQHPLRSVHLRTASNSARPGSDLNKLQIAVIPQGIPCETLMIMDVKPSESAASVPVAVRHTGQRPVGLFHDLPADHAGLGVLGGTPGPPG